MLKLLVGHDLFDRTGKNGPRERTDRDWKVFGPNLVLCHSMFRAMHLLARCELNPRRAVADRLSCTGDRDRACCPTGSGDERFMPIEDTTDNGHFLAIVIDGPGVSPDRVNADEWFELLTHYQRALVEAAALETGEMPSGVYFALTNITPKCIQLRCPISKPVLLGARRIGEAVRDDNREALTEVIWTKIEAVATSVAKRGWNFCVHADTPDSAEAIVELHDPKQLPAEPKVYRERGEWVAVGKCPRVNLEKRDAALLLANEAQTRIHLTGSRAKLKELGQHLDELIEIRGMATWRKPRWELEEFELESFRLMGDTPVQMFAEIPEATRREFEDLDPFEIREILRGGDHE